MKNSMLLTLFLIVSSISFLSGYQNFRNSMIPRVSTSLALSNTNVVLTSGKNMQAVINGNVICYDLMKSVDGSAGPPIIYLPGLIRAKNEAKSITLQSWCKKMDFTFFCADYFGVGRSSGKFSDGTISQWVQDSIFLIEKVLDKSSQSKAVLVGHGVGSWISFLIATKRPDLVRGIVGMSADPDFTEQLLWNNLSQDIKDKIMNEGSAEITWGNNKYPISRNLIEDGRKNLLLTNSGAAIPVRCPVRLMHALDDEEVPYTLALQLIKRISSPDASVVLIKASSHAMDQEADFKTMRSMIQEVINANERDRFDLRSPGSG